MPLFQATGAPPWMLTGNFGALTLTTRIAADANLEKFDQAVRAAMPGVGTPTALPYIGTDNVLTRGPNESDAQYAARNSRVYDTWDFAGTRRAVLEQLWWFLYPAEAYPTSVPVLATVTSDGLTATWATLFSSSDPTNPTLTKLFPTNWNWDGKQFGRRAWLIIYEHSLPTGQSGTAASITANSNDLCTVTGLSGMTSANVGQYLVISGAASSANNVSAQIVAVASSSSATVAIVGGVAGDAHNGALVWSVVRYPNTRPGPVCGAPGFRCDGNSSGMLGDFANVTLTCGLANPPDMVGLQATVRQWKSATTWYPWFLFSFSGGDGSSTYQFNPNNTTLDPAGTWGTWATPVAGANVYARRFDQNLINLPVPCDGTGIYGASVATGT